MVTVNKGRDAFKGVNLTLIKSEGHLYRFHFASELHFTADKCTPQIPSCPREVSEAQFRRTNDHGRDFVLATQGIRYKNE